MQASEFTGSTTLSLTHDKHYCPHNTTPLRAAPPQGQSLGLPLGRNTEASLVSAMTSNLEAALGMAHDKADETLNDKITPALNMLQERKFRDTMALYVEIKRCNRWITTGRDALDTRGRALNTLITLSQKLEEVCAHSLNDAPTGGMCVGCMCACAPPCKVGVAVCIVRWCY